MIRVIKKLDWMTNEDYEEINWFWGCVCDYNITWKSEEDYEAWCKRVLKK